MMRPTTYFPIIAVLFAIFAYRFPAVFIDLKPAIVPLLMAIMFSMGLTLGLDDFKRVLRQPRLISLGLLLQYLNMPLAAYVISILLGLPTELMIGMVLVGASAGGTASNVVCYLAKGDVALSITLTMTSTLVAVIAMPMLTALYVGQRVPVPVTDMLTSIVLIVAIPVLTGVLLNSLMAKYIKRIQMAFPLVSIAAIVFIIAIIVALNHQRLQDIGALVILAIVLHNLTGLLSGYWLTRWLGYGRKTSKTLAIEVGMQNSGLSVALAIQYFSPLAALPGALFSIWHNISGSILAGYWSSKQQSDK